MDFASLRDRLLKLLPLFIILMSLMGIGIFAVRTLLPGWQDYELLSEQVDTGRAIAGTQIAAQNASDNQTMLQHQISNVETNLQNASTIFLTDAEAEQVLNRLYSYAYLRGVRVVNLQAQQQTVANESSAYNTSVYQLQISGEVTRLIDFVAHFPEASLPSVSIANLNTTNANNVSLLTMTLFIYTSPYASGEVLREHSEPIIVPTATPTPTLTPSPTPEPPTAAPTLAEVVAPTATLLPTETPSPTQTPTLTPSPTPIPTETVAIVICPGIPPTLFEVGDIAVVDFNTVGALRMLSDPNGSVLGTRTQAYDNDRLEIVTGPVCANGAYYWYIRNLSDNNTLGWVAEGQNGERWLCPEENPECT